MYTVRKLENYSPEALVEAEHELRAALNTEAESVETAAQLKEFRDRWAARKSGIFTQIKDSWLAKAPTGQKPQIGMLVNTLSALIKGTIDEQGRYVEAVATLDAHHRNAGSERSEPKLDITLPGIQRP